MDYNISMYQIVHGSAGLLIGSQTGNPWLAFILGFISHFVLDAVPHDSIEIKNWQDKGNYIKKVTLEATVDTWLFLIVVLIFQMNGYLDINVVLLAALVGVFLPDYIWGFTELFKIENRLLEKYIQLHKWIHMIFYKSLYLPAKYALSIQLGSLIIFLGLYLLLFNS